MISIIIPNYNGEENLKRNLPKVIDAMNVCPEKTELIVVDDASVDRSRDAVCSVSTRIKIIQNPNNLGFAESCNVGVNNAKGEIIILLNSDVYPDVNFISPLVRHFKDGKVFAVGCLEKTLNEKDEIVGERGIGRLFFKNGIYQHSAGDLNSSKTDWVCGGSGAFRRGLYLKLGGFDKNFAPFYWEDVDLSFRAKKTGFKLLFEKRSIVYHQHDFGAIASKYSKKEIEKISFKNQLRFTKKHANFYQKILLAIFLIKRSLYSHLI